MSTVTLWLLLIYPLGTHMPEPIWDSPHASKAECEASGAAIVNPGIQWFECKPYTPAKRSAR